MKVENNFSQLAQQPGPWVTKAASADTPKEAGRAATHSAALRAAHPVRPWPPRSREDRLG